MALTKTIILPNHLEVKNAYIRIDTISGYKGGLTISVNFYVSQDEFQEGSSYLEQKFFDFVPLISDDSPNFIKQGYEYLKTLPDFEGAVNC